MERDQLFNLVDMILNSSSDSDIDVIMEAIKRRAKGRNSGTIGGINPEKLAKESGASINQQMSYSMGSVRKMIQDFAVDIIRKEAPELKSEQIQQLLDAWVPDSSTQKPKTRSKNLPQDVLYTMIRQLLAFSAGTMSASEQSELYTQIPDWQREYWNALPEGVCDILTLFIKGSIDEETCWDKVNSELSQID